MRESEIERYLVRRVREAGGQVRKVRWVGRRGAPDRLVLLPGRSETWVELKRPGGRTTVGQLREHEAMRAMGAHVVVIDSLLGVDALLLGGVV
jgi:hypothetical protein